MNIFLKKNGVYFFIIILLFMLSSCDESRIDVNKNNEIQNTKKENLKENDIEENLVNSEKSEEIKYIEYTVDELTKDLELNSLNASDKYKNKHLILIGQLDSIDSDGKYISINPIYDEFSFIGVNCYIINDSQLKKVKSLRNGQLVRIKGKITDVGEVLGYSMDISDILLDNIEKSDNTVSARDSDRIDDYIYDEYILPTNTEYISISELEEFANYYGKEGLRLAVNEMFARHGAIFKKQENIDYFTSQSWYYPVEGITDDYIKEHLFNDYEKENLKNLLYIESLYVN